MNKLKKQKINHVLNYEHFLKDNSLKRKKLKLKKILFENPILYKNQDLNIIELNNYENIEIPLTVLELKEINTIEKTYNNQLLFNYNLNYNILYNFNKIIFNYIKEKRNNKIKGKVITGYIKRTLISILGFIFATKSVNLNHLIRNIIYNKKKIFNFKKFKMIKNKKNSNKLKNRQIKKIIRPYTLRYLNFKIIKTVKKYKISRVAYLTEIFKYKKEKKFKNKMLLEYKKIKSNKNNKSILSRKAYEKKFKKKQ
jgi:hypothetical protein